MQETTESRVHETDEPVYQWPPGLEPPETETLYEAGSPVFPLSPLVLLVATAMVFGPLLIALL